MEKERHEPLIDPVALGSWIAEKRYAWQMRFLGAKKMSAYARSRGVTISSTSGNDVMLLWR